MMKKSTKGALAAGAAGVLLLGGAGSLAYWTDAGTVNGTDITSGHLALDPVAAECDDTWRLNDTEDYVAQVLVPGDTLTRHCTYTVDMAGDNLEAELDVSAPDLTGTLADGLSMAGSSFTVDGVDIVPGAPTTIVDGASVAVDLEVDFAEDGTADNAYNDADGLAAALDDVTVTATQVH